MWLAVLLLGTAWSQDRGARGDDVAFAGESESAYTPAPRDRLWYSNATFARINPLAK